MSDPLAPVLGDPFDVSAAGSTLTSIALDVAVQASRLRSLAGDDGSWAGKAASAARSRTATLPPMLDKAHNSYAAAGDALASYARALASAQEQSVNAISAAGQASADLAAARSAQAAAASRDAHAAAIARTAQLPIPAPTASRYQSEIDEAAASLKRAYVLNASAHQEQEQAARVAASALRQASQAGIHNASWMHRFTHAVGSWASAQWVSTLRTFSRVGSIVSGIAGVAALTLAVAGVFFPPLEVGAAVLETVSLTGAVVAGVADTALAASGNSSWTAVGVDALTLAPAGLGRVVTKAAPLLREGRFLKPSTIIHVSEDQPTTLLAPPRDSRGLAFPGGLVVNDAAGGHVLTHIGLDEAKLAARGLPEASTFVDRVTAEGALADLQSVNAHEIDAWLMQARPGAKMAFSATFDNPVGRIFYREKSASVEGSTAIAVLRADASSSLGYHIVTGYVAP